MRAAAAILVLAVALSPLTAYAIDVWGDQWGTWTRDNSPYNVIGEIRVPPESTLMIEPGILVNFQGHYKFIVDSLATLLAVGTEADSIYFTAEDTATGWHGIRFIHSHSNCQIAYCHLQHGKALGNGDDRHGGAICCFYSCPAITNSLIRGNYADEYGGGIYCKTSSPTIRSNYIGDNWARGGGGVFCNDYSCPNISGNAINGNTVQFNGAGIYCWLDSSPIISDNTIADNFARWNGGGIYCNRYSSPVIMNNVVRGNWADWSFGGGIYCYQYSDPWVTGNDISGNFADLGGGIYCWYSSATISSNVISGNFVYYDGGGILCDQSYLAISCNTIGANLAAWGHGGGICSINSHLRIRNTILWGDSASLGQEVYVQEGSSPVITHCDVQGGWPGTGNIDADPLFAGPYNDDFHLRWHSPCINAGDPALTDPDGTRSDIGAFYFNLAVLGIVEVYPHDEPIVIPPQGGDITYDGGVLNLSRGNLTVDIWGQTFVPGLIRPYRLWRYNDVTIPFADSIIRADLIEHVPGYAPSGDYSFVTYIGDFPSSIIDSTCMYFTKEDAIYASGERDRWQTLKGWFEGSSQITETTLPRQYSLSQNYPNPFNARTVINYQLPADSDVKLEVCNVLGQKVATLVDSKQQAGYRSVIWDASTVSSGVYFYRLSAGDYTQTRRMMLVK